MKALITTIGIALLAFANANAENVTNGTNGANSKVVTSIVQDPAIAHPVAISVNETGIEQAIAEDSRIIENGIEPAAPLLPGKSQEEIVADDNLVIESAAVKEIYPLDFKKINARKPLAKIKNDRLVGSL